MGWQETVRGHTAWAVHGTTLAQADQDEWPEDETVRDAIDRVRWVLRDVWARFEGMDPRLVASATLDALQSQFAQARDALVNLRSNPAYVPSVHAACDAIISSTATWPRPPADADIAVVHRTATDFQANAEKALAGLVETVASASVEADKTKADFAAKSDALQALLTSLSDRVEAQTSRLDAGLNALGTRYDEAEAARSDAAEAAAAERVKAFESERERTSALTSAHLSKLEVMLNEARTTLQAIGVTATASHYGTYADQQRKAGFRWAIAAVAAGLGCAVGVVWALHGVAAGGESWQSASMKSLVSTIVLAVAGYAATQSAAHRREERRARRIQLGLAVLDPFLANVDGDDVKTLRLSLGAELFAAPAKEQEQGFSPLASLQQALTHKALAGRVEVTAKLKDSNDA
ncbi:hypothetical protein CELL_01603 [Cellulomonas sp. T2.31MG-18]|uniref:hypothetical protein n=1 Tax=Cellulomonas sp. T2.31MG-18 TaxID=3157619 RepID=UPI0035E77020